MRVFIIPDMHLKFVDKRILRKIYSLIAQSQPHAVVQSGDLYDMYMFSRYPRSVMVDPVDEAKESVKLARDMWAKIHEIVPSARKYQLMGNHDMRMMKRIHEKLPEIEAFYDGGDIFTFKNVQTLRSDREFLELDGVIYCHGWLSKSIDHAKYFNKPTVHSHRHRPAIETEGHLWSMDAGYVADNDSLPLSYTPTTFSKWRKSCGEVDDQRPHLILL